MPHKVPKLLIVRWSYQVGLGTAISITRTPLGSVNGNFFMTSSGVKAIVTLFDQDNTRRLVSCFCLMHSLAINYLSSPTIYCQKLPACCEWRCKLIGVVAKLVGDSKAGADVSDLGETGRTLSVVHRIGRRIRRQYCHVVNPLTSWASVVNVLRSVPSKERCSMEYRIASQLSLVLRSQYHQLPNGLCHCDLFADNLILRNTSHHYTARLTGCLDFYFSGQERLLRDVGVVIIASCLKYEVLVSAKVMVLSHSYQTIRPLTLREKRLFTKVTEVSSFRFWVVRLLKFYKMKTLSLLNTYDPAVLSQWDVVLNTSS